MKNKGNQSDENIFFRELDLTTIISVKCVHIVFFLCWLSLLVVGTTVIGFGASNFAVQQDACDMSQEFCTYDLSLDSDKELFLYLKISPFYQNNRMYLDSYSLAQLHGNNGSGYQCGPFSKYSQLGVSQTVGGYRVISSTNAHPCGYPMKTILNDQIYVVDSEGGTPGLDNSLTSNFSLLYHFSRLNNYPQYQWTDVKNSRFVNWFTISTTSTKYMLMGRLNMTKGEYEVIYKNVYPTQDLFTKNLIISETNSLGITNHLLGFCIFGYSIIVLLIHVGICCKITT